LIFLSRLPSSVRLLFFVSLFYLFYILFVGGDVLYGARFFMPVLAPLYLCLALTLVHLVKRMRSYRRWLPNGVIGLVLLTLAATTFLLPVKWLMGIRYREIFLVNKMKERAEYIIGATDRKLTIACSTIGAFAYYSNLPVIDLLGLTDREIAKNPKPAAGLKSTWKERNYNIPYLMRKEPDLILFSTGIKPSAPAERALFLSSKFRTGYYPVFNEVGGVLWTIYRKADNVPDVDLYYPDPDFINDFHEALNLDGKRELESAFESALQTVNMGPDDFYLPVVLMGDIQLKRGKLEEAMQLYHQALEMSNGKAVMAAYKLSDIYDRLGDSTRADHYADILLRKNRLY
jgi:tetratricopeptide (TPR) repeat protein